MKVNKLSSISVNKDIKCVFKAQYKLTYYRIIINIHAFVTFFVTRFLLFLRFLDLVIDLIPRKITFRVKA